MGKRAGMILLLPIVLLLGGCFVEEDTITINKDGLLRFDSVVTVEDADQRYKFEDIDRATTQSVGELQGAKWKVERTWVSKERPYKLKFTGSGKLGEVAPTTKFYKLERKSDKRIGIVFLAPGTEKEPSKRSIVFTPQDGTEIRGLSGNGKPVSKIDKVTELESYVIQLP